MAAARAQTGSRSRHRPEEETRVNTTYLLCLVIGHRYAQRRYPDSPDGYYLHCGRCHHERDDMGTQVRLGAGRGPR